jgi:hypothetical protein
MDQILRGEACFYQGIFILHQGYHDDYACSFGGVAMSGGNGMYQARVGTCGHVLLCQELNVATF